MPRISADGEIPPAAAAELCVGWGLGSRQSPPASRPRPQPGLLAFVPPAAYTVEAGPGGGLADKISGGCGLWLKSKSA